MLKTLLLICLSLSACAAPGQVDVRTPQGQGAAYPFVLEATPAREQAALEAWRAFLSEFQLPTVEPDWEPVLYTPRALPPMLAGQIKLNTKGGAFGELEAKEALKRFLARTRAVLLGDQRNYPVERADLSLVTFSNEGNFFRAIYRQVSFPYPVANGYGELSLVLSKNGELLQWGSRIIPQVNLPARAQADAQALADGLVGREFTYASIAGRPLSYKVANRTEISVKELVVYPKQEGRRLTIYLAYAVEAGSGMSWTVYFDALSGQEIEAQQNFAS